MRPANWLYMRVPFAAGNGNAGAGNNGRRGDDEPPIVAGHFYRLGRAPVASGRGANWTARGRCRGARSQVAVQSAYRARGRPSCVIGRAPTGSAGRVVTAANWEPELRARRHSIAPTCTQRRQPRATLIDERRRRASLLMLSKKIIASARGERPMRRAARNLGSGKPHARSRSPGTCESPTPIGMKSGPRTMFFYSVSLSHAARPARAKKPVSRPPPALGSARIIRRAQCKQTRAQTILFPSCARPLEHDEQRLT